VRGEILLKRDPVGLAPAEDAFRTLSRRKAARRAQLRTAGALSLAKLYRATDRAACGQAVLAPALEGFSLTSKFPELRRQSKSSPPSSSTCDRKQVPALSPGPRRRANAGEHQNCTTAGDRSQGGGRSAGAPAPSRHIAPLVGNRHKRGATSGPRRARPRRGLSLMSSAAWRGDAHVRRIHDRENTFEKQFVNDETLRSAPPLGATRCWRCGSRHQGGRRGRGREIRRGLRRGSYR